MLRNVRILALHLYLDLVQVVYGFALLHISIGNWCVARVSLLDIRIGYAVSH